MMPGLNEFFLVDGFFLSFSSKCQKSLSNVMYMCVVFFFKFKKGDFFSSLISSPFLDVIDNPFQSLVEPETY